ncbi:MAG TPA: hypothetical protein VGG33_17115 [Polyangia bacterium]
MDRVWSAICEQNSEKYSPKDITRRFDAKDSRRCAEVLFSQFEASNVGAFDMGFLVTVTRGHISVTAGRTTRQPETFGAFAASSSTLSPTPEHAESVSGLAHELARPGALA